MAEIQVLPEKLRNRIAAGEIVERPASVLKELMENSIDAGSSRIDVDIGGGGHQRIHVADNGSGMAREDAILALNRHATSKLRSETDLDRIQTFGFRGEALPSIASVAVLRIVTAVSGSSLAVEIHIDNGKVTRVAETAAPTGTQIEVLDLFHHTPARRKFMKSPTTEFSHIVSAFQNLALPHPEINFHLTRNGQNVLTIPSVKTYRERVFQIMGEDWINQVLEIDKEFKELKLTGFISNPPFSFATRDHQEFFVNRRAVRSPLLAHALSESYDTSMMKGRYPAGLLFLEVPFDSVDVNIHPAKKEVRFHKQHDIHETVRRAIELTLRENVLLKGHSSPGVYSKYEEVPDQQGRFTLRDSLKAYDSEVSHSDFPIQVQGLESSIHPLGQIDQTYILAQIEGELHIIDQHAAHERVLFDRLMAQLEKGRPEIQPLLFSETVTVSPALAARIKEILPHLRDSGLEVEVFGEQSFLIRSIPALLGSVNGQGLLLDLLEELEAENPSKARKAPIQKVMASMACHGAIKAHQGLGSDQIKELLRDLENVTTSTCPHGRPIRVKFTLPDLEKLFHRK